MTQFEDYKSKYSNIRMERSDGVLEITFHTNGKTLVWGSGPHSQLGAAFHDIERDKENKIVIMTGTGDAFIEEIDSSTLGKRLPRSEIEPTTWHHIYRDAKRLLMDLLDIEVPVIAAVNGPVNIHAEIAVLSDIVLASDTAVFQDAPHVPNGLVPGDGVHVIWPHLLGINRGRYFLLTGQRLSAQEALKLGVVNEVLAATELLPRARQLARQLLKQPPLTLRYARVVMVQELKEMMLKHLSHGLALEGLAAHEYWPES
ncbi:enoyl-CoA hydratase/isomerase family protein [Bradyrhizobium sp. Ai1a-2]|uniref:enoyl-CoA hydratase/isomerase family protein n=1 Tax=Bradyrhizobium sp. Ai1a-2 TaxID=196490 RepID=UPI000413F45C|nr:enoyl-CoA hydratase/isomerase family protein [Bradyrhizobium sp. Ai1a-2]